MKYLKKIMAAVLSGVITVSAAAMISTNINQAEAISFSQINQSSVFVKQQESFTCTLASNVMMLRRAAMLNGDKNWSSITERSARSALWCEGVGMYHEYNYKNMQVKYERINGNVKSTLINALKKHPEGIVVYEWDYPHAVLLTDYSNGNFYCADPARNTPSGRIHYSKALINVNYADAYWYVSNAHGKLTSSDTAVMGYYEPKAQNVNETWKINTNGGVNLRTGHDTYYSSMGIVPNNTTVKITKKIKMDDYTWGYTNYRSKSGWLVLDYAKKVNQQLTLQTSVSNSSIWLGNTVTVKASAVDGKSPYQYTYSYRLNKKGQWTTLRKNTKSSNVQFKPTQAGQYEVSVEVKDANNRTVKKTVNLTVRKPMSIQSSISATHIAVGNSITIKANANSGKAPYLYTCYYRMKGQSKFYPIRVNTYKTEVSFKPTKATAYEIRIEAVDANKKVAKKSHTLFVNPKLSMKASVSSKSVAVGDTVTLRCQGKDGVSAYQYAYYYRMSGAEKWCTIQNFGSSTSVTFKPKKAGQYEVAMKVKDAKNHIVKTYEKVTVH